MSLMQLLRLISSDRQYTAMWWSLMETRIDEKVQRIFGGIDVVVFGWHRTC